jgi:hypothetical protein
VTTHRSKQTILVFLVLFLAVRVVFHLVLSLMHTALLRNNLATMLIFVLIAKENARPRE